MTFGGIKMKQCERTGGGREPGDRARNVEEAWRGGGGSVAGPRVVMMGAREVLRRAGAAGAGASSAEARISSLGPAVRSAPFESKYNDHCACPLRKHHYRGPRRSVHPLGWPPRGCWPRI
jgi:hypothetical protein